MHVCISVAVWDLSQRLSVHGSLSFFTIFRSDAVGARQAKKDSPLENPMVDRTSQVLVWGSVVGTVAIAAVSL